jgi:hypothetical protein
LVIRKTRPQALIRLVWQNYGKADRNLLKKGHDCTFSSSNIPDEEQRHFNRTLGDSFSCKTPKRPSDIVQLK